MTKRLWRNAGPYNGFDSNFKCWLLSINIWSYLWYNFISSGLHATQYCREPPFNKRTQNELVLNLYLCVNFSCMRDMIWEWYPLSKFNACWSQFHQHFTCAFFVRKQIERLFSTYIRLCNFLAPKYRRKIWA